jgi:polyisoprenoid-binding protein YceI
VRAIILNIVFCLLGVVPAFGLERRIDTVHSSLTVHVEKAGLLSGAGHEHTVAASIADGSIDDGANPKISFRVFSNAMTVLPEEHQGQVQNTMQEKVLESTKYPEIRFASGSVLPSGEGRWIVSGNLSLHGRTKTIRLEARQEGQKYVGEAVIKQTDFGIQPIRVAAGTIRVKNELKISFILMTD